MGSGASKPSTPPKPPQQQLPTTTITSATTLSPAARGPTPPSSGSAALGGAAHRLHPSSSSSPQTQKPLPPSQSQQQRTSGGGGGGVDDDDDIYQQQQQRDAFGASTTFSSSSRNPMLLTRNSTMGSSQVHLGRTGVANLARETALGISTASSKGGGGAAVVSAASPTTGSGANYNNNNNNPATVASDFSSASPLIAGLEIDADGNFDLTRTNSKANSAFASAKVRARVAEKEAADKMRADIQQQQQQQHQLLLQEQQLNATNTISSSHLVGGTATLSASQTGTATGLAAIIAKEARQVVNGTSKIKNLCDTMNKFRSQLKKHKEVSDSDIVEMKRTQEQYTQLKLAMAQQIASIGEHVDVVGKPNRQLVYDLLEGMMSESEVREGTLPLLSACICHLTPFDWQVDFAVGGKKMIPRCAQEGWFQFLDVLLTHTPLLIVTAADAQKLIAAEQERYNRMSGGSTLDEKKKQGNKKSGGVLGGGSGDDDNDDNDFLADVDDDAEAVDPFSGVGDFVDENDEDMMSDSAGQSVASMNSSVKNRSINNTNNNNSNANKKQKPNASASSSATSPDRGAQQQQQQVNLQLENFLDPVELLKSCAEHPRFRIPLIGTLAKHWSKLRFVEYSREMLPTWNSVVRSLCSSSRSHRGEDRTQRLGLLSKLLSLSSCIPVNVNAVDAVNTDSNNNSDGDNNSLLSRSIVDGETAVFQTLTKKAGDVDWAAILPDGHSLLTLACACAQKQIVELLLNQPLVDINYEAPGHGTALEIVKIEGGGNQQITNLLEARLKKIDDERHAAESAQLEQDQKSHMRELKKRAQERRRKLQDRARKADPPKWIEENPPTGPLGVDTEKDEDWIDGFRVKGGASEKNVVMTGPMLDIINTLREHWTLLEHLTSNTKNNNNANNNNNVASAAVVTTPPEIEILNDANADGDDLSDIDNDDDDDDDNNGGKKRDKNNNNKNKKKNSFLNLEEGGKKSSFTSQQGNSRKSSFLSQKNDASRPASSSTAQEQVENNNNNNNNNNTDTSETGKKVDVEAKVDLDLEKGTLSVAMKVTKTENVSDHDDNDDGDEANPNRNTNNKRTTSFSSPQIQPPELTAAIKATAVFASKFDDNDYMLDGETLRQDLIATVLALGPRILVEGKDPKEKVYNAVNRLLSESTKVKGSLKLARVLMYRVITVDFAPSVSGTQKWALRAAKQGDVEALETLLRVDKLWREEHEVVELVTACVRSKEHRFALCLILLRHQKTLRFGTYRDHLRPLWEEVIDATTNPTKMNFARLTERERNSRFELYCRLFANPGFFQIRHDIEIVQGITYFSRACRLGDLDFVRACILYVVCDVNKVYSNKSTPLMQAVVGNQLEVVAMLCRCSDIDPFIEGPNDSTALDLAKQMGRDQAMIDILLQAGEQFGNELLTTTKE